MGSSTDHTTVALRMDGAQLLMPPLFLTVPLVGKLYVTESTNEDEHWPVRSFSLHLRELIGCLRRWQVNGIQKTEWDVWIKRVRANGEQVVR